MNTLRSKLLEYFKETLKEYTGYVLSRAELCETYNIKTKKDAREFLDVQNQPLEEE